MTFIDTVLILVALGCAGWALYLTWVVSQVRRESAEAKLSNAKLKAEKAAMEADLATACQQLADLIAEHDGLSSGKA